MVIFTFHNFIFMKVASDSSYKILNLWEIPDFIFTIVSKFAKNLSHEYKAGTVNYLKHYCKTHPECCVSVHTSSGDALSGISYFELLLNLYHS